MTGILMENGKKTFSGKKKEEKTREERCQEVKMFQFSTLASSHIGYLAN